MILKRSALTAAATLAAALFLSPGGAATATEQSRPEAQAQPAASTRFVLTAHDGRIVSDADFRGRHLLVFFGYTHCPDVCPSSLLTVARVLELLGPDAAAVQALFVTVDPERDTRQVLAGFVAHFDQRIIGLTGSPAMIERLSKGYRVKYAKGEVGSSGFYSVDHTATMFHMGPDGELIQRIPYETAAEQIVDGLRPYLNAPSR